ncbi:proteasome subunit alpha [Antrihabitans stalactiti]|uniref:Proteasome subunit alpha n=1 Tax=Antrihabitans stalactiti TaxID=2584121 RepID=A0A848KKP9_9NOCA|nr:proteasome subunit alpha [Antrihabitans stalactiti]NMN98711.1 proteasome subunit alpha [Antrihabitans stalactiti]
MTLPYYASAEQIMRDRSELARKGIGRGRSVVVLTYDRGVLFVAENPSTALHKVSELYDRIGFAAVGKYNEFENLRRAGIMHADTRGYAYDRRDVTGRTLANAYAQTLGSIFTDQLKPYEVEICVAEVGYPDSPKPPQLYRITYDGSIGDEREFIVMGGTVEPIVTALKASYKPGLSLEDGVAIAVSALQAGVPDVAAGDKEKRTIGVSALEVAVLDQTRPRRAFKRVTGAALEALIPKAKQPPVVDAELPKTDVVDGSDDTAK